jgi:hypothetical protein
MQSYIIHKQFPWVAKLTSVYITNPWTNLSMDLEPS